MTLLMTAVGNFESLYLYFVQIFLLAGQRYDIFFPPFFYIEIIIYNSSNSRLGSLQFFGDPQLPLNVVHTPFIRCGGYIIIKNRFFFSFYSLG